MTLHTYLNNQPTNRLSPNWLSGSTYIIPLSPQKARHAMNLAGLKNCRLPRVGYQMSLGDSTTLTHDAKGYYVWRG